MTVESYADLARIWWGDPTNHHGPECPDLPCADLRVALSDPEDAGRVSRYTNTSGEARVLSARPAESALLPWEMPPAFPELGQMIRRYRLDRWLSQTDLAKRIYVHPRSLTKIEQGKRRPSQELLLSIATELNVTDDQLAELLDAAGHPARARGTA